MKKLSDLLPILFCFSILGCSGSGADLRRTASQSEPVSPTWIDSLPLVNKEDALDAFLKVHLSEAEAQSILDYRTLFPDEFRIAKGVELQDLVDTVVMRIVSTTTGKKSLCFLASDETKYISAYLGVSRAAADNIKIGCRQVHLSAAQAQMFDVMKSEPIPGAGGMQFPKKFVFLISEKGTPAIEGFTTMRNVTVLDVSRKTLETMHLVRLFSHELAMSYDQFVRVASTDDSATWEGGLSIVYDKPAFTPIFEKPKNLLEVRCAIADPALRYAAATERAFRFEDEIAHELGDQSHDAVNGPCAKSLETWITYFPKYFQVVRRDLQMDVGFFYDNCDEGANRDRSHPSDVKSYLATLSKELNMVLDGFGNQSNPTRQAILAKRIAILENTTLMFRKSSRPENLCALLLEPKVGPHYAGMLGGGPRPRVGGW